MSFFFKKKIANINCRKSIQISEKYKILFHLSYRRKYPTNYSLRNQSPSSESKNKFWEKIARIFRSYIFKFNGW